MSALALVLTIATLFWCLRLLRWQHSKKDRYLMALLGLIATYQGLQILSKAGFWAMPQKIEGFGAAVDMTIAGLYFIATLILQFASADRHNAQLQLRVAEANQSPAHPMRPLPPMPERTALAVFGVDSRGDINLWHSSAEDFFGWRKDDVVGTRLPFCEPYRADAPDSLSGLPRMLRLRTRRDDELDAIVWFMAVPGESSSLVLVLDYRQSHRSEPVRSSSTSLAELSEASQLDAVQAQRV